MKFFKGCFWATVLSIPLWVLIVWGLVSCSKSPSLPERFNNPECLQEVHEKNVAEYSFGYVEDPECYNRYVSEITIQHPEKVWIILDGQRVNLAEWMRTVTANPMAKK